MGRLEVWKDLRHLQPRHRRENLRCGWGKVRKLQKITFDQLEFAFFKPWNKGDKADVDLAVAAAKKAFAHKSTYRNMDASRRGELLWKLADLIEQNQVFDLL